jgi:CRP/FNR family transcriptional regulator, cyclic AMP receptor protein
VTSNKRECPSQHDSGIPSGQLGQRDRDVLVDAGTPRRWTAGAVIFSEGERSDHVILIRSGQVKVAASAINGKQAILAFRGAGDLIGELASIDGRPRSATVTAFTEVTAVSLTGAEFRHLLRESPRTAFELLRVIVSRAREADLRRLEFGAYDVQARLASLLLDLVERYGEHTAGDDTVIIRLALSQTELADASGASRETVTKALKRYRELGAIRTSRRRIEVVKIDVLRALAGGAHPFTSNVDFDAQVPRDLK